MPAKCEEEYEDWLEASEKVDELKEQLEKNEEEFNKAWDESWEEVKDAMINSFIYGAGYLGAGHPEIGAAFELNYLREAMHATDKATEKSEQLAHEWDELQEKLDVAESKQDRASRDFECCAEEHYGDEDDEGEDDDDPCAGLEGDDYWECVGFEDAIYPGEVGG